MSRWRIKLLRKVNAYCLYVHCYRSDRSHTQLHIARMCIAIDQIDLILNCVMEHRGVASSIPARSHTFVEIDHEIISTVILLPSADSFKKGCCQLQAKVCAQITGYPLVQACPGKSVVRWTDRPVMTKAVDLGRKATKQLRNGTR